MPFSVNETLDCRNQPLSPSGLAGVVAIVVDGASVSTLIVGVTTGVSGFPATSSDQYVSVCCPSGIATAPPVASATGPPSMR